MEVDCCAKVLSRAFGRRIRSYTGRRCGSLRWQVASFSEFPCLQTSWRAGLRVQVHHTGDRRALCRRPPRGGGPWSSFVWAPGLAAQGQDGGRVRMRQLADLVRGVPLAGAAGRSGGQAAGRADDACAACGGRAPGPPCGRPLVVQRRRASAVLRPRGARVALGCKVAVWCTCVTSCPACPSRSFAVLRRACVAWRHALGRRNMSSTSSSSSR